MRLALIARGKSDPVYQVLTRLDHTVKRYNFNVSSGAVVDNARAGDLVRLEVVSPPWPGWSAKCSFAEMTVNYAIASPSLSKPSSSQKSLKIVRRNDKMMKVAGNGAWKAGKYIEIEVKSLPLSSLKVSFVASDQGHGGTGSSLVRLNLLDGNTNASKVKHVLQRVTHSRDKYEMSLTVSDCDVLKQAVVGDRIVLEAVSPPWQAWECILFNATMKLIFFGTGSDDMGEAMHFGDHTQDYESALNLVQKNGGYLLLIFSGSDWCGWCKLMDNIVFSKTEWEKTSASMKVISVLIDFPKNQALVSVCIITPETSLSLTLFTLSSSTP